jgi:hygromycin-B 4-O-kinase
MKTTHTPQAIHDFLLTKQHAQPDSIHDLAEGHVAQASSFINGQGDKLVLRIAPRDDDFLHDKYAFEAFGTQLPIPRVREIGRFDDTSYFCISDFVEGIPSDKLKQAEINAMQPEILCSYAALFNVDVSSTTGYGSLDINTGNGKFATWRERLEDELNGLSSDKFRTQAKNINLDVSLVDKLMAQAKENLQFAPETRGLIHGDLGFDNMLVQDGKVVAFIDCGA